MILQKNERKPFDLLYHSTMIGLVQYVPYFFGEISRIVSIGFSIFDTSAHDIKNSRIELISFGINQKK